MTINVYPHILGIYQNDHKPEFIPCTSKAARNRRAAATAVNATLRRPLPAGVSASVVRPSSPARPCKPLSPAPIAPRTLPSRPSREVPSFRRKRLSWVSSTTSEAHRGDQNVTGQKLASFSTVYAGIASWALRVRRPEVMFVRRMKYADGRHGWPDRWFCRCSCRHSEQHRYSCPTHQIVLALSPVNLTFEERSNRCRPPQRYFSGSQSLDFAHVHFSFRRLRSGSLSGALCEVLSSAYPALAGTVIELMRGADRCDFFSSSPPRHRPP